MQTRFFYKASTNKWLRRLDTNSAMDASAAVAHAEAEFALPGDVGAVDTDTLTMADVDALRVAVDWVGTPPEVPTVAVVDAGNRIEPPSALPNVIAAKKAVVEAERNRREAIGTSIAGVQVPADGATRNRIKDAYVAAKEGEKTSFKFKKPDGNYVTLNIVQIINLAKKVAGFIEDLSTTEAVHFAAIDALTTTAEVEAYDVTIGWPV